VLSLEHDCPALLLRLLFCIGYAINLEAVIVEQRDKPPLLPSCTVGGNATTSGDPAFKVPDKLCLFLSLSAICQPARLIVFGEAFRIVTDSCPGAGPMGFTSAPTIRTCDLALREWAVPEPAAVPVPAASGRWCDPSYHPCARLATERPGKCRPIAELRETAATVRHLAHAVIAEKRRYVTWFIWMS